VISSFRVCVNKAFLLLERSAVLIGSYRRFGKAYHSNEWANDFEPCWVPVKLCLSSGTLCPLKLKSNSWDFCPFMKTQLDSRTRFLTSLGSKENELREWCQSVTKASHVRRAWAEVSFCAPHLLHRGLSVSPIVQRCCFVVLHQVRRPVYNYCGLRLLETNIIEAIAR
jgi:hypothetical protein